LLFFMGFDLVVRLAIPPSSFEALFLFARRTTQSYIVFLGFYLSRADGSKWVFWHKAGKT
jgi:hypothetical protein